VDLFAQDEVRIGSGTNLWSAKDADGDMLEAGSFYWALPVLDIDTGEE
jgi:hypothetical protein